MTAVCEMAWFVSCVFSIVLAIYPLRGATEEITLAFVELW